jgi:hypothetical protein
MRKINTLKKIVLTIFIIILIWFLADNVLIFLAIIFENDVLHLGHFNNNETPIFLKAITFTKTIAFAVFIYGSSFLIKILLLKNVTDFLNNKTSIYLKKAGVLIIFSNIVSFILSFAIFFIDVKYFVYFNSDSRYLSLYMIIFGFFLVIFSKVIEKAKDLKQENDLTI